MQKPNPKTIKVYLPGEVLEKTEVYQLESGEVVQLDVKKKILVPSKKNQKEIITNRTTGKMFLVGSRQFAKWTRIHKPIFEKLYADLDAQGVRLPIVRCKIKALFYFPDSKDRDLTNKFDTLADALRDHDIIADDKFKVMKPIVLDGFVCRNKPRTEIYITIIDPLSPEYNWDITSPDYEAQAKQRKSHKDKVLRKLKKEGLR